MRLVGSIEFEWNGHAELAVSSWPEVVITLDDRWVAVGMMGSGTKLVPWESVRSLSGYAPVAAEDR